MNVTSLYTNIPQNEGIEIVCKAYKIFNKDNPPIPTHYLREMLKPGFHMIVRIVPIVPVVSKMFRRSERSYGNTTQTIANDPDD